MLAWLKDTWYFFIILTLAQTARVLLFLTRPEWHTQITALSFNFVLILTSFFISWRTYARYSSILKALGAAIGLYVFACVLMNLLITLIAIRIMYPALLDAAFIQLPSAVFSSFIFLPLVIILAYLACRVFERRQMAQ